MTFEWFKNMLSFGFFKSKSKPKEIEPLPEIKLIHAKNRDIEIIQNSQLYLAKLKNLCDLTTGLDCNKKFKDVLEIVSKVHDKCINDETIPIKRIEEFHSYYTEQFLNTFNVVLEELKPKPKIDKRLSSEFILQENINLESSYAEIETVTNVNPILDNIFSIDDFCIELKIFKENGYESFAGGYASYLNDAFNLKKKSKKHYEKKYPQGTVSNYHIRYLGELKSQNILLETIKFEQDYCENMCLITKLDINTSSTTIIKDISKYYNKNLIKY